MIKHNQDGAVNGVAVSLVLCILILIAAIVFGVWAYGSRQDYKNNTDQKISAAVAVAKQQESTVKDKEFVEKEKNPLRTYTGPEAYGSILLSYPKTWSGVVDSTGKNGNTLVDAYFAPGVVPSLTDQGSTFSVRMQVISQAYADTVKTVTGALQQPTTPTTMNPYALPKLPKVVGLQIKGSINQGKTGEMIVLPLRSQTLELWTEGSQYTGDFENIILPNFSFSP